MDDIELKVKKEYTEPGSGKLAEGGDRAADYQIATEEQLHTGRSPEHEGEEQVVGKPKRNICSTYAKPICILITFIIIAAIGALVVATVVMNNDEDELNGAKKLTGSLVAEEAPKPIENKETGGKSCPEPFVYNADKDECLTCPESTGYGYIKATKSCGTCPEGKVYDMSSKSCIECPCQQGDKCKDEKYIWRGSQCMSCPIWMKNAGYNYCVERCSGKDQWNGEQCDPNYRNERNKKTLEQKKTPLHLMEAQGNTKRFMDFWHKCTTIDIHMSYNKESGAKGFNPFFPRGVRCCEGDSCTPFRGNQNDAYSTVTWGEHDACFYGVEFQKATEGGYDDDITAIRWQWYAGDKYHVQSLGDFDEAKPIESYPFKGCLHGFYGWTNPQGDLRELGFLYDYDNVRRCGHNSPWAWDCKCHGNVYYGLYRNTADNTAMSFEKMKEFNPDYLMKENVDGNVKCVDSSFEGKDPWPGKAKQCFCEAS